MGWANACLVVFCGQFLLQQFKFLVLFQQPAPGIVLDLLQVLVVFCAPPATNIPCSGYLCAFWSSKWSQISFHIPDHYILRGCATVLPQKAAGWVWGTARNSPRSDSLGVSNSWVTPKEEGQSVLSVILNHSNSHCEGCGQQGSSAAEVFNFGWIWDFRAKTIPDTLVWLLQEGNVISRSLLYERVHV